MSQTIRTGRRGRAALALSAVLAAVAVFGAGGPDPARAGVSATGTVRERPAPRVAAVFDPAARETRVTGRVEGLCVALALPLAWTLDPDAAAPDAALSAHLQAADGPALDLALRPARSLPLVPLLASRAGLVPSASDALARRAAAALQREHESFLGRPAQSVTLTPLGDGALRWTATWLDPQLSASGALTIDAAFLPLSSDWVLELALSGTDSPALHEAVLGEVLQRVRVGRTC
ncbi:MAG TPA: hypothetical protein VHL98_10110 [Microvirga sp.]|jgi:hypothetical protein|nr:hypothetical protein [Microvirga sp.]